ncbi:MAG TPA: DUF4349 domain-containing protein [Candidatus Eisenbacteria bacterium]|nr:DUF4349 domain-containing protein [Candidatus Eisenbacteria bacterium]
MTPQRTKKIVLTAAGAMVGLVLIAAVVALTQGTPPGRMNSAGSSGSPSLGLAYRESKMVAPGAPQDVYGEAGAASDSAYAPTPYPPGYQTGGQTAAEVDQKIIKNGSLRLTVDNVSASLDRISAIAKDRNGFVQSSSASEREDGKHDGQVTIRVPVVHFEAAVADLKALATIVNYEATTGQDVTEQYTDLQAQLRNAKAQEEEYLRIMKKAESVEDILKVQERLGYVRGQIESLEGRIKYLENQTSLSTITVSLTEEVLVQAPTKEFRPGAIVKQAVQTLVVLGQRIVAAVIWIAIVGGGIGIPVLALVLIVRAIVRAARAKRGQQRQ